MVCFIVGATVVAAHGHGRDALLAPSPFIYLDNNSSNSSNISNSSDSSTSSNSSNSNNSNNNSNDSHSKGLRHRRAEVLARDADSQAQVAPPQHGHYIILRL